MKYIVLFTLFLVSFASFSQQAIDTVETDRGTMIIYANRTWKMLEDTKFNGVLNEQLHSFISTDTDLNFVQTWDNEVCFTSDRKNDLSRLKDTIWLCLSDSVSSSFVIPNPGYVTSRYGYRKGRYHNGIDIGLNIGDTVRAAWSGKIRYAKYNDGGFGNLVIIRHENGLETFYAHLSKHLVFPNDEVKAGDPIGLGGNTGRSFGPHLHFEVRFYDAPINPEEMIDFADKNLKDENLFVHKGLFRPGAKPSDYLDDHDHNQVERVAAVVRSVNTKKYYKVRPGDTLSQIATKNKTTISALCKLNGMRETTTLQIGKSLRVK
jgi:hypothetical protein